MGDKIVTLTKFQVDSWIQVYGSRDARYGGLVLGNRHIEGSIESGVKMVNSIGSEIFRFDEMEGGEYLMCPEATIKYRSRLDEINQYEGIYDEISEERIKDLFSAIRPSTSMEMLVLSGKEQYIIRRSATSKYLEELDKMNELCIKDSLMNKSLQ